MALKSYASIDTYIKVLKAYDGVSRLPDFIFPHKMIIGGRTFEQITYGGPPLNAAPYSFVLYRNIRSGESFTVKYDCPTSQGGVQTKVFKYLGYDNY